MICFSGSARMMCGDGLTHATRAAVYHQPQAIVLVGLKLDKMVAPPQRAELVSAIAGFQLFQADRSARPRARKWGVAPQRYRRMLDRGNDWYNPAKTRAAARSSASNCAAAKPMAAMPQPMSLPTAAG